MHDTLDNIRDLCRDRPELLGAVEQALRAVIDGKPPANNGDRHRPWQWPEELVTLDQMAATVHRSKRTLERYLKEMPLPRVRSAKGRGFANRWAWSDVRPWLEAKFGINLGQHPFTTRSED